MKLIFLMLLSVFALALSPDQTRRLLAITNTFENSKVEPQYEYIENLNDGRGYTAGVVGFCTGTGDLLGVVETYRLMNLQNQLVKYLPRLRELAQKKSDSTQGLAGFEKAWKDSAKDPKFIESQEKIRSQLYLEPAMKRARDLGISLPMGQAILYDTLVMHGEGTDPDGLPALIDRTNRKLGCKAPCSDQKVWLREFLKVRKADLLHPADKNTEAEWSKNAVRADILLNLMDGPYQNLDRAIDLDNHYFRGKIP